MKSKKSSIMQNAFWQLLLVYTILVVLIALGILWKYTLHMEIFAIIIAVIGALGLWHVPEEKIKLSKTFHYSILALAFVAILAFRIIPYLNNTIPLGYDAGIYKYGIEHFAQFGFNSDQWVLSALTPGFLYLTTLFVKLGISTEFLLIHGFIAFNLLLGFAIYLTTKEYFETSTALIATLLFAVSTIQFQLFTYLYYKNIIALSLLLFALYFYKKDKQIPFILFGILTGIMHRPTFFLFGVAFISLTIHDYKKFTKNVTSGAAILILTLLLYAGFWQSSILPLFQPVAEGFISPGSAPGTFVSFFVYQFSSLYYLPFAILGFLYLAWQRKFNLVFLITALAAVIVYFQFFFFNRFIAHLDIFLIILAASGFMLIIKNKKALGLVLLVVMLLSSALVTFQEANNTAPLVREESLELIKLIPSNTPENAKIMSISSEYSPWVLAYSGRDTIAPGLFKENKWTQEQWELFWQTSSEETTIALMSEYSGPVYLFAGTKSFNNPCFEEFLTSGRNKLLRYSCDV